MSTIVASQRPTDISAPIRGTEGPKPGFWDTVGASFRAAEDEQELTQAPRNAAAYDELLTALGELGIDISNKGGLYMDAQSSIPGALRTHRVIDRDAIYAEVLRQRERDPKKFTQLPKTRAEYDQWVARRKGARDVDLRTAERGGLTGNLVGGGASAMTEPYNIVTLAVGAGQASVVRTMVIEGLIGMGVEPLNFSSTESARARMGEDYTAAQKAQDVVVSGLASGALGGLVRGVELSAPKVGLAARESVDAVQTRMEQMIAEHWDKLPEAVRTRWQKGATILDADLPDLAEAIVGRGNMSVDERAAIDALRRDADIDAQSPFKPNMAGAAAHRHKLDDALNALLQPVTRQPRSFALPANPASDAPLSAGTSLSTPSGGTARSALKGKIRRAESGGDDLAKNDLSSATGRYQFLSGTWVRYYKRRFGAQGLSDSQIAAKRSDPVLQEQLMDDLTADNAAFLRSIGEAETAGNLYLTHFAGAGGAKKIFAADPNARAVDVLGEKVVRANPWMRDYTAGDVIAWAHRKMNEATPRRAGGRTELADGVGDDSARLQAELDRIDAEEDAARRARDAEDPLGDALNGSVADLPDGDLQPLGDDLPPSLFQPVRASEGLSDRELTLLPAVRSEVQSGAKLSDIGAIAARLEATEQEVERLLGRLAATEKGLLVQRKDGSFRRAPTDKGPVDAYKYIARAGGMADDEGHGLVRLFGTEAPLRRKGRKGEPDGVTMRWQSRLIPGAGPLVRQGGLSIDRVGELLYEGGYLRGAEGGQPTISETIAYLERGMAGKEAQASLIPELYFGHGDEWVPPQGWDDMRTHMWEWSHYQEIELDADDVDALTRIRLDNPDLNEDDALAVLTSRVFSEALDDARFESGDYDDAFARYLDNLNAADGGEGRAPVARDAGEGRASGATGRGDGEAEPIDLDGYDAASDAGIGDNITASAAHDLDADLDVFEDADGRFFYLDEGGEARGWADIKAELEEDAAELKNIGDCL